MPNRHVASLLLFTGLMAVGIALTIELSCTERAPRDAGVPWACSVGGALALGGAALTRLRPTQRNDRQALSRAASMSARNA